MPEEVEKTTGKSGGKTMLQWNNILLTEFIAVSVLLVALGLVKLPRLLGKKKLQAGFPWGYYPDRVPKTDPGFFEEDNESFLYDVGTGFSGIEGFGDYGEFSGFGELGEFGQGFSSGQDC